MTCPLCSNPVRPGRRYCSKACAARGVMADPAVRRRHSEAVRQRFADPEKRAAHVEVARRNSDGMHLRSNRQKAGATRRQKAWADIPFDLRPLYLKLRPMFGARHARRMIAEQIAADQRRAQRAVQASLRRAGA